MSEASGWPTQFGLVRKGNYYEGHVDDLSSVLEIYQCDTTSTWDTNIDEKVGDTESQPT